MGFEPTIFRSNYDFWCQHWQQNFMQYFAIKIEIKELQCICNDHSVRSSRNDDNNAFLQGKFQDLVMK